MLDLPSNVSIECQLVVRFGFILDSLTISCHRVLWKWWSGQRGSSDWPSWIYWHIYLEASEWLSRGRDGSWIWISGGFRNCVCNQHMERRDRHYA